MPSQSRYPAASALEALIKQSAGFNIKKHWVSRHDDGSGIIEASNTCMNAEAFPVFLVTEDWSEAEQAKLASGYIERISSSLLTLQHLGRNERERIKKSLNIQSASVEHHWHLYPEIIDECYYSISFLDCRCHCVDGP